jgi:hypothetical protein
VIFLRRQSSTTIASDMPLGQTIAVIDKSGKVVSTVSFSFPTSLDTNPGHTFDQPPECPSFR